MKSGNPSRIESRIAVSGNPFRIEIAVSGNPFRIKIAVSAAYLSTQFL